LQLDIRQAVAHVRRSQASWWPESTLLCAAITPSRCRALPTPSRGSPAAARIRATAARPPARLAAAMSAHPEMVSGEGRNGPGVHAGRRRRLGDQSRRRGRCKRSACVRGWGIAIKVADGARAVASDKRRGARSAGPVGRRAPRRAGSVAAASIATSAGLSPAASSPW
jgi:hypothetical protein